jgi:hypothetical protein
LSEVRIIRLKFSVSTLFEFLFSEVFSLKPRHTWP